MNTNTALPDTHEAFEPGDVPNAPVNRKRQSLSRFQRLAD
jgi:hypothetical protein